MASISGAKVGTFRRWLTRSSRAKPTAMPNRAVRMGKPIATNDPKAMSMMIMAARMPKPSLEPGDGEITLEMTWPPSAT